MATEMILCMDVVHDVDAGNWYGHATLVPRVDGKLDFRKQVTMIGNDADTAASAAVVRKHLLKRAAAMGWKWDRLVVVSPD